MSAIMKLHDTKKPDKVFVCYDFKQVRDAVLIVMFIEKQKRYEKIFIYEGIDGWETDILKYYADDKSYDTICKKLEFIFEQRENTEDFDDNNIKAAIKNNSSFLMNVYE